jgi:photosystem II stability/assembly factor-like uncharacterized protein
MMRSSIFGGLAVCAVLAASFAVCPGAGAQTSVSTTTPIVVKEKPTKAEWLNAEVVHADKHSIIVRERDNSMLIHTFTYSEKAQNKMDRILDDGGYQSGDSVKIRWMPGGTEALDIKGRPSKP